MKSGSLPSDTWWDLIQEYNVNIQRSTRILNHLGKNNMRFCLCSYYNPEIMESINKNWREWKSVRVMAFFIFWAFFVFWGEFSWCHTTAIITEYLINSFSFMHYNNSSTEIIPTLWMSKCKLRKVNDLMTTTQEISCLLVSNTHVPPPLFQSRLCNSQRSIVYLTQISHLDIRILFHILSCSYQNWKGKETTA